MEEVFHFTSQTGKILQPLKTDKKKNYEDFNQNIKYFSYQKFLRQFLQLNVIIASRANSNLHKLGNHYLRIKLEIKRFKTSTFNLLMWNLPKSRNSSKFSTLSFKHHS